jgi:phenylacetate-coenzyme A ligase PaaK-like adenylate-forming protein
VFNQYGSREIPNIACECQLGKMHVFSDMVMLESVPPKKPDRRAGKPPPRHLAD